MSGNTKAMLAVIGCGVGFLSVICALPAVTAAEPRWVVLLWCTSLAACALLLTQRTRAARALAAWTCVLPLATLAVGAPELSLYALTAAAFLIGAASLLGVRMYVPEIIVTDQDVERLSRLLDVLPPAQRAASSSLEAELARAKIVPPHAVPPDVVTMNSRVIFEDEDSGKRAEAVLGYPHSSDVNGGVISVLAPVGTALLGLRAGQRIDWPLPTGRCKRIRVVKVLYQPEAAGDFHL